MILLLGVVVCWGLLILAVWAICDSAGAADRAAQRAFEKWVRDGR